MRLIAELAIVGALIAFGWKQSFSERVGMNSGGAVTGPAKTAATARSSPPAVAAPQTRASAPAEHATATPSGAWMWDPNRQGSLDRKTSPQPRRP